MKSSIKTHYGGWGLWGVLLFKSHSEYQKTQHGCNAGLVSSSIPLHNFIRSHPAQLHSQAAAAVWRRVVVSKSALITDMESACLSAAGRDGKKALLCTDGTSHNALIITSKASWEPWGVNVSWFASETETWRKKPTPRVSVVSREAVLVSVLIPTFSLLKINEKYLARWLKIGW